jgi:uncharacterized protein (TIRG00374 family)
MIQPAHPQPTRETAADQRASGNRWTRRTIRRWLPRLLGPLLLLVFLVQSDLAHLRTILLNAAGGLILLALLLMPAFVICKVLRWRALMHQLGIALPLGTGLGLYTVGIFLGSTTPGQAGDLLKAWYLHARGHPHAPALLSVLLDRLCDLLLMGLCATLGVIALGPLLPHSAGSTLLVLGLGSTVLLLALTLMARCSRQWLLLQALPAVLPTTRTRTALTRWNRQVSALTLHPRLLLVLTGTSLGAASVTFFRFWLLFAALDITLPLTLVIGSTALISMLRILPISIAGLGVQEAVLLAVLVPCGYTPEQALSVAALFLLLTLEHILVGYIVSFWYPLGQEHPSHLLPPCACGEGEPDAHE